MQVLEPTRTTSYILPNPFLGADRDYTTTDILPTCVKGTGAGAVTTSYPSPPMSQSPSPTRRPATIVDDEQAKRRLDSAGQAALVEGRRGSDSLSGRTASLEGGQVLPEPDWPRRHSGPPSQTMGRPLPQLEHQQPLPYPSAYALAPHASSDSQAPALPGIASHAAPAPEVAQTRGNRPARRTKAHVASACVNCKRAHLSCDVQRPCARCVASGKQDSCYDVQHKKRGRPRLRDERDKRADQRERFVRQQQIIGPATGSTLTSYAPLHVRPEPFRILRSHREPLPNPPQTLPSSFTLPSSGPGAGEAFQIPRPESNRPIAIPIAYLNLDLVILDCNQAFRNVVALGNDVRNRTLSDLLDINDRLSVSRVQNELREERRLRDPTHLPPIQSTDDHSGIPPVTEHELQRVTQGFSDRVQTWTFRLPNGGMQTLQVRVRLARTTVFFATLLLPPAETFSTLPPPPVPFTRPTPVPSQPAYLTASPRQQTSWPPLQRSASYASSGPSSPFPHYQTIPTTLATSTFSPPVYPFPPPPPRYEAQYQHSLPPPTTTLPSQPSLQPLHRTHSTGDTPSRRSSIHELTNPSPAPELPPPRQLPPLGHAPTAAPPQTYQREPGRGQVRRRESDSDDDESRHGDSKRRRLYIKEVLD